MIRAVGLVLFTLLKIMGWLLLVLFLILAAVLLLVLFVPVRYQVLVQNERIMDPQEKNPVKKLQAQVKIRWLLRFVNVSAGYGPEGVVSRIRLAGIDLKKVSAWLSRKKKEPAAADGGPDMADQGLAAADGGPDTADDESHTAANRSDRIDHAADLADSGPDMVDDGLETADRQSKMDGNRSDAASSETDFAVDKKTISPRPESDTGAPVHPDVMESANENITEETQQARASEAGPGHVRKKAMGRSRRKKQADRSDDNASGRQSARKEKAGSIRTKLHRFRQEYKDEINRSAVSHLWVELCRIMRSYMPGKLKADLSFSLADPALTGEVLGLVSLMPQIYRYPCTIVPDFASDQLYIEGELVLEGKVTMVVFLISFLRLILDKKFMKAARRLMGR